METPTPKPCGRSYAEITEFAEGIAALLEISPEKKLEDVVEFIGGSIEFDDATSNRASIKVEKSREGENGTPKFVIYLSKYLFPLRKRFSIAHELGHLFLHAHFGKQSLIATHSDMSIDRDDAEVEANWFASAFLIPAKTLRKKVKDGLDSNCLAAYFNAPEQIVIERMKRLEIQTSVR